MRSRSLLSLLPVQSAPTGPASANWRGPGHVRPACRYGHLSAQAAGQAWSGLRPACREEDI